MQDVMISQLDQCQYGLWIEDKEGKLLAKKPTKFMTNSPGIVRQLTKRCEGAHTHTSQANMRAYSMARLNRPKYIRPPCATQSAEASSSKLIWKKGGNFI